MKVLGSSGRKAQSRAITCLATGPAKEDGGPQNGPLGRRKYCRLIKGGAPMGTPPRCEIKVPRQRTGGPMMRVRFNLGLNVRRKTQQNRKESHIAQKHPRQHHHRPKVKEIPLVEKPKVKENTLASKTLLSASTRNAPVSGTMLRIGRRRNGCPGASRRKLLRIAGRRDGGNGNIAPV